MKVVVKKKFVGFDREFMPGEIVDFPGDKIEKLNNVGLGIILELVEVEPNEDTSSDAEKKSKKK